MGYTSRLWCCCELFVYTSMALEDDGIEKPIIFCLGRDEQEENKVRKSWTSFDVTVCKCFSDDDKKRILAVIEQHEGGTHGFSSYIQNLAKGLFGSSDDAFAQPALVVEAFEEGD